MNSFAALADNTRREIVRLVAKNGELTSTEISQNFEMSPPAISQHLKILKEAKDVKESVIADAHNRAKEEAAKIVASAKIEIDAQKKAALAEVKNEVSKLSLEIAQKVLGRELDATKDQQTYINSLVDKMN